MGRQLPHAAAPLAAQDLPRACAPCVNLSPRMHSHFTPLPFLIRSSGWLAQEVLAEVPPEVDTLVFPNYESLPEAEDVEDPFLEVSLFKKNYAHVVSGDHSGA